MKKVFLGIFLSLVMIIIGGLSTVYYLDYAVRETRSRFLDYETQKSISHNEETKQEVAPTQPEQPKVEQTVEQYEASIPLASIQSPLYVRYGGNCFVVCRTEDAAKLRTHHTDYKGFFIEDIKSAMNGGGATNFSSEIRAIGTGVKFSFNGMSYDLTKRQCEKLIYDFEHPQPYLG